jgi:hypothetical protein
LLPGDNGKQDSRKEQEDRCGSNPGIGIKSKITNPPDKSFKRRLKLIGEVRIALGTELRGWRTGYNYRGRWEPKVSPMSFQQRPK